MEVILLEKIDNLGSIGDTVKVKSGYGRNYLIPQGKATLATPEHIAEFEERRAELEAKEADSRKQADDRASAIAELGLVIPCKVGSEGKLFGSVGTIDIAAAAAEAGAPIERDEIRMPDGPIRLVGEHEISVHLHADVDVPLTINVIGEGGAELEERLLAETTEEESADESDQPTDQSEADSESSSDEPTGEEKQ